jgi:hypothetical protein
MKSTHWSLVIGYWLKTKDKWYPSIALSLLTTLLGLMGISRAVASNELPEQPDLGLGDKSTQSQAKDVKQNEPQQEVAQNPQLPAQLESTKSLSVVPNHLSVQEETQERREWNPQGHGEAVVETTQAAQQRRRGETETQSEALDVSQTLGSIETVLGSESPAELSDSVPPFHAGSQSLSEISPLPLGVSPRLFTEDALDKVISQAVPEQPGDTRVENRIQQTGNSQSQTPTSLVPKKSSLRIEILPVGDPRIPADGRSTLTLNGRITDENGQLITKDAIVTLTASAGKFVGADQDKDQLGFQAIARGGEFTVELQSGVEAQKVRIRAAIERTQKPEIREQQTNASSSFFP